MKKFPSLIKLPRHKRFNFEPRYYDPIKEDIENRIAQIKSEMGHVEGEYRSNLSGSFKRNYTSEGKASPGLLQLLIFTLLFGGFVGWMFLGNIVLYALSTLIPVYFYLRIRGKI